MRNDQDQSEGDSICNNPTCTCAVSINEQYCSKECRSTAEIDRCTCEHDACQDEG